MNFRPRVSRSHLRVLLPLLAALAVTVCKGTSDEATAGPPPGAGQPPPLYVLGSTIHLRKAPAADAQSLEKLRIGTECAPLEPVQGEWRKVRCGDKEGYASAALLGAEKPSVEKLGAEARDPKLPLVQREDAALRAATLAPENVELRMVLGDLFFERNFELLAGAKKPLKGPELTYSCLATEEPTDCIASTAGPVRNAKRRAVTKGRWFVLAIGDAEQIFVYRGRFRFDTEDKTLTEVVMERTRFASTPVVDQALFPGIETDDTEAGSTSPRLGELVLDGASQAVLGTLPGSWWLLKPSGEGDYRMWRDECAGHTYVLKLSPDVHGRWFTERVSPGVPLAEERWVSAVSRTEHGSKLTLVSSAGDPEPQVLEIPKDDNAVVTLGEAHYHSSRGAYPDDEAPCGWVEPVGPSFSGEFQPEKAMAALYGRFDAASGTSRWAPTASERDSMSSFENFRASRYLVYPWKWASWREGEQEKMLFLTETRSEPAGHPSTALIGGGVFARTGEGWRLERARRVITELGSFGGAPGFDISVQGVSPRGFVAVLQTGYTAMGASMSSLELLSDGGGGSIQTAGSIPDISEDNEGACDSGEREGEDEDEQPSSLSRCFSYDSKWKFVPHEGNTLPDFVVTTKGSRLGEGKDGEFEHFHEVRRFVANERWYSLVSRAPVRE
ncbi:hypothetical protein [Archangium sp.]|uniref:hypothetical protein n=1 Tax=Archangium sp. TaxID=1872627 RepID=UPI00389B235C